MERKYNFEVKNKVLQPSHIRQIKVGNTGLAVEVVGKESIMSFLPKGELAHYIRERPVNAVVFCGAIFSLYGWINSNLSDKDLISSLSQVTTHTTEVSTGFTRHVFSLSERRIIISDTPYNGEHPYLRTFGLNLSALAEMPQYDPLLVKCRWAHSKLKRI